MTVKLLILKVLSLFLVVPLSKGMAVTLLINNEILELKIYGSFSFKNMAEHEDMKAKSSQYCTLTGLVAMDKN